MGERHHCGLFRLVAVLVMISVILLPVQTRAADGYFKQPYDDYGLDTDGDSYYDFLVFNATLQVNESGKYLIQPTLKDGGGNTITTPDLITKILDPGDHPIQIKFDGVDIYIHGVDGPYLVKLVLFDEFFNGLNTATNWTKYYQYTEFQRPPVEFAPPHYDYGLDTNSNGLYDYLVIMVNITVHKSNTYTLKGNLYDQSGTNWITDDTNETLFPAGDITVRLDMLGFRIRQKKIDGPYRVELQIVSGSNQILAEDVHTTNAYLANDFEGMYAYFMPPHSDTGLDPDGDGADEYLRVTFNVRVNESAYYNLSADLYDKSGLMFITDAWNYTYLSAGLVQVDLYFLGCDICESGYTGFYYADAQIFYEGSIYLTWDEHKTANYPGGSFDCSPPIVFSPPHLDHGLDTDGDTLYNYLVADISIDVAVAGDYKIVGRLYDLTRTDFITDTWNASRLDVGPVILPLWLNGSDIYISGIDGPYNLTLLSYDRFSNKLEKAYYNTSYYSWNEFEHEVIDGLPPQISAVLVDGQSSVTVPEGTVVTLTATISDSLTGGSNIGGANYTIGSQNWPGTAMSAQDGAFNSPTEDVTATVDTTGWIPGDYDLYVYGWDVVPNYNTTSSEFARITITAPVDTEPPEISSVAIDGSPSQTYYLSTKPPMVRLSALVDDSTTGSSNVGGANFTTTPSGWPGTSMLPLDGSFDSPSETAYYDVITPDVGTYDYYVYAWDDVPNYNNTGPHASLTILDDIPPEISSVLVDGLAFRTILEGTPSVALTATIDDIATGGSPIQEANYTVGMQNWPGIVMDASDGAYDSPTEDVNATVDTSSLAPGTYDICVYALDGSSLQNENTTGSCAQLQVVQESEPPEIFDVLIDGQFVRTIPFSSLPVTCTLTATIDDSGTGGSNIAGANYTTPTPSNWPGTDMNASDGAFDSSIENVEASFSAPSAVGTYPYYVYAWDERWNYNSSAPFAFLVIEDDLPPRISNVLVNGMSSITVPQGTILTLTATASDVLTGGSNITAANYTDGQAVWPSASTMVASDGSFDSPLENLTATLDTGSWTLGIHEVYVYATDSSGNGNVTSIEHVTINITIPDTWPPEILNALVNGNTWAGVNEGDVVVLNATVSDANTGNSMIGGANYTIGMQNWPGIDMSPVDGAFDSSVEDVTVVIDTTGWTMMNHTVCVYAWDIVPNENTTSNACVYIEILAVKPLPPLMTGADLTGPGLSDVIVRWSRSGDDGIGRDDVIEYDVYMATSHSGPYSYVTSVPATNSAEYNWTCVGCGLGDSNSYFFYVEADNGALTEPAPNRASKFLLALTEGPQLISVPLVLSSEDISFVLQTVQFDMAYHYDSSDASWKSYMPFKAYKGDLTTVNRTMGLWVNVTSPCDFVVAGLVPTQTTITLRAGWNLVGFPSFTSYTLSDLKMDVNASNAEEFDPSAPPHFLRRMSDADAFQAGRGYWIEVPEDVVWTVMN